MRKTACRPTGSSPAARCHARWCGPATYSVRSAPRGAPPTGGRINRAAGLLQRSSTSCQEAGGGKKPTALWPAFTTGSWHPTGVGRVICKTHRHGRAIDKCNNGNGENKGTEEPVGDVDMGDRARGDGAEEHQGVENQGDQGMSISHSSSRRISLPEVIREAESTARTITSCQPQKQNGTSAAKQQRVTGSLNAPVGRGE